MHGVSLDLDQAIFAAQLRKYDPVRDPAADSDPSARKAQLKGMSK